MLDILKCGEDNGRFYDRRGDYFREGVDPRNHYGRFVPCTHPKNMLINPSTGMLHCPDCNEDVPVRWHL